MKSITMKHVVELTPREAAERLIGNVMGDLGLEIASGAVTFRIEFSAEEGSHLSGVTITVTEDAA